MHIESTQYNIFLLVPCAGVGSRAVGYPNSASLPKQYQPIAGKPMLAHTLDALSVVTDINAGLIVISPSDEVSATLPIVPQGNIHALSNPTAKPEANIHAPFGSSEVLKANADAPDRPFWQIEKCGADSRAGSVLNGLNVLIGQGAHATDWVLVHDAARCLLQSADVQRLIDTVLTAAAQSDDPLLGGVLAVPLADTLKAAHKGHSVATLPRSDKWLAQTPQMFRIGPLLAALENALASHPEHITDEASAIEMAGGQPLLVQGSRQNFKITYPEDFVLAEALLKARRP